MDCPPWTVLRTPWSNHSANAGELSSTRFAQLDAVTKMTLTASEQRVLRAALKELEATLQSDFNTLREYHNFLHEDDDQVSVNVLAEKLGLELPKSSKS